MTLALPPQPRCSCKTPATCAPSASKPGRRRMPWAGPRWWKRPSRCSARYCWNRRRLWPVPGWCKSPKALRALAAKRRVPPLFDGLDPHRPRITLDKIAGALVTLNVLRMQGKRAAIGKAPQVAAVNSALKLAVGYGLQKCALTVQAAVAALHAFAVHRDRNLFEAQENVVEIVRHRPLAQRLEVNLELGALCAVVGQKASVHQQKCHEQRHQGHQQQAHGRKGAGRKGYEAVAPRWRGRMRGGGIQGWIYGQEGNLWQMISRNVTQMRGKASDIHKENHRFFLCYERTMTPACKCGEKCVNRTRSRWVH